MYLKKLFRATEIEVSELFRASTITAVVGVQPSVFGELKHYLVSKGNH